MRDCRTIMNALMADDIPALEEISEILDDFPMGKDDFIHRHWITNAIDCGSVGVVRWMLEKHAPVVFLDDCGYTVLHSAIERDEPDKYEMMRLLIASGADMNAHGVNDWTPAHMAAVHNDVEALRILRDGGADFTKRTRIDDYATPLEEAIIVGKSPDAVAFLKSFME
jgi:ankyrin repeat protein